MTSKLLFEIAFWIVIVGAGGRLIWELIPDGWKKFWYYRREQAKDRRKGRRRKYSIRFR